MVKKCRFIFLVDYDNCIDDDQRKRNKWKREFSIRNNSDKLTEVFSVMEQLQNDIPLEKIKKSAKGIIPGLDLT